VADVKRPSDMASAGPLGNVHAGQAVCPLNSQDQLADQPQLTTSAAVTVGPDRRARHDAAEATITVLAQIFSATFVADRWLPHRPLKVGIYHDLVALGLFRPSEAKQALRHYCCRLQYRRALAVGGERVDFSGAPAGEVTPDEIEHARAAVAKMEVKRIAKAEAARQENKRIARRANGPSPRPPPAAPTPPSSECTAPRLLGLDDLKRAALARRGGGQ
jgi:sRNA-binding protein